MPAAPAFADLIRMNFDAQHGTPWLKAWATEQGLFHDRHTGFSCRAWSLDELAAAGYAVRSSSGGPGLRGNAELVVQHEHDGVLVEVNGDPRGGTMALHVIAATAEAADATCAWFDETFRENRLPREETRVPIHFWTMSAHGPRPMRMMIEAPRWAEIAGNYSAAIRDDLARAMAAGRDQIEGVALWRGEPGTGKTTALRALAMEWAPWCDVHVIVDPEVFLGDQASYLMDVLFSFQDPHTAHLNAMMAHHLSGGMDHVGVNHAMMLIDDGSIEGDDDDDDVHGDDGDGFYARYRREALSSRAKLIVLEDAGELVTSSARVSSGQALSRLLNISDGMLGQGANISVLVTTNEEIGNLHPAIQRPGRSWAQVEFEPFSKEEAQAWLAERDFDHQATGEMSIAELYAIERGDSIVRLDNISNRSM
jgi:hypothetical protein